MKMGGVLNATTWEYKAVHVREAPLDGMGQKAFTDELNGLGSQSWEAFAAIAAGSGRWVLLKRSTSK